MLRHINRGARLIYGCYAWSMIGVLSLLTVLLLLLLPSLRWRRALARGAARVGLNLIGVRFQLLNEQQLPKEPCVIVANHSSYVDGMLLKAVLPARFSFVIKKEMVKVPIAGLLLRRIGSQFVDRANRHSGGLDTRRLFRQASEGGSLVFFPEGTFTGRPGLAPFHLGAFITAQRSGLPIVPIAIRGARRILRSGSPWPRPGRVELEVLPVIDSAVEGPTARITAETLRDQARVRMLFALDEPDLSYDAATVNEPDADQVEQKLGS